MNAPRSTILLLTLAASLTAQQAEPRPGETMAAAWQRALDEAKKHKAPLLVFVLPDDGPVDGNKAKAHREAEVAAGMLVRASKAVIEPPAIATRPAASASVSCSSGAAVSSRKRLPSQRNT